MKCHSNIVSGVECNSKQQQVQAKVRLTWFPTRKSSTCLMPRAPNINDNSSARFAFRMLLKGEGRGIR